jgi:RimJ/RimL family protein N-acetyltransferase
MVTSPVPDLVTDRLLLRAPATSDVADWAATIWGDAEVMEYMPKSTDPRIRSPGT